MSDIKNWSNLASGNNSPPPDGAPEGTTKFSDVNDIVREMMAAVRRQHEGSQWIDLGHTVSYMSSSSFKVVGHDVTSHYAPTRRVQTYNGSGSVYGDVLSSTYAVGDTSIYLQVDSGGLDTSLSSVALGIISPNLTSLPKGMDSYAGLQLSLSAIVAVAGTFSTVQVGTTNSDQALLTPGVFELTNNAVGPYIDFKATTADDYEARIIKPAVTSQLHFYTDAVEQNQPIVKWRMGDGFYAQGLGDPGDGGIHASAFYDDGVALPTGVADASAMEAAASSTLAVPPALQQRHPLHAKAWAMFNGSGAIQQSSGITSLVRNSAGLYTVTFSTAFSGTTYAMTQSCEDATNATGLYAKINAGTRLAGSCQIRVNLNGAASDIDFISVAFFGDQ